MNFDYEKFDFQHRAAIIQMALQGAVFYVSHSGGKDSQAMYAVISNLLRDLRLPADQLVVVHADLGEVEHTGVKAHIRDTIGEGKVFYTVQAIDKDGNDKDLLGMIEARAVKLPDVPSWPSASIRYCTSDLKRGPIEKFIRGDLKARGKTLAVSCMGLRAEESPARAKKATLKLDPRLSKAGRSVYHWLPIHHYTTEQVFDCIAHVGQEPHPVYKTGNERLSCVFCIFGSDNDLRNGAVQRPDLARKYIELERRIGWTMFHKKSLEERLIGVVEVV
jgi:3'-phosphoadenosine 5'-phosphosulfate sulfotransferase (PAPS reductase)/FAD synthetase